MEQDYKEIIQKEQENWLKENAPKSQLLGYSIMSMKPNIGYVVNVNGMDIPEDLFTEEYSIIVGAYFSYLEKLDEYYHNNKKPK